MSLTKPGPAFHWTWKVPAGVACGPDPGLPGSIRTGPKLTLPSDCSQVRWRVRSTQAVAAAGQSLRSSTVSTSGASWAGNRASTTRPAPIRAGAADAPGPPAGAPELGGAPAPGAAPAPPPPTGPHGPPRGRPPPPRPPPPGPGPPARAPPRPRPGRTR